MYYQISSKATLKTIHKTIIDLQQFLSESDKYTFSRNYFVVKFLPTIVKMLLSKR